MSPDYLYNLDAVTSRELGEYPGGLEVAMVTRPAHAGWRTPKGIEIIGPRHFGFDFDYVALEELQKMRPKAWNRAAMTTEHSAAATLPLTSLATA